MLTQTRPALNITEKATIAAVITWDSIGKVFQAEEIESLMMVDSIVIIKLSGDRSYPIHRDTFKSIRRQQVLAA